MIPILHVRNPLTGFWHSLPMFYLKTSQDDFRAWNLEVNHPVGTLWWSNNPKDPGDIVGGTWERIMDKFILAAGPKHPAGSTGGVEKITLTKDNLPNLKGQIEMHGAASGTQINGVTGIFTADLVANGYSAPAVTPEPPGIKSVGKIGVDIGKSKPVSTMSPYEAFYCWKRIG